MSERLVIFLCAVLVATPLLVAQQADTSAASLSDLLRAGLANNKDLAAVRERISEAKGVVRQAGVRPAPTLALSGATAQPFGTSGEDEYGVEYSQPVETFGKRSKRIQVAEFSVGLAEAELQERSVQLAFQIAAAFEEVQAERRKLKVLTNLIGMNGETLRLTEARVKEGDVAPIEAALLKVEISRAEVARMGTRSRLTSTELELRRLVGWEESTPIPDSDFFAPATTSLEILQQRALQNRADLKIARLEEEQGVAGVALAKAEAKPDLTISAGYARRDSQFDGLYGLTSSGALSPIKDQVDVLAFGLSIPLRTSRSGTGNVQAAAARSSGARLRKEYLEKAIPLEVKAAYERWRTAINSLQTLESGVLTPSTANLSVIQEAYKLGQLRLLDVLNEQRRLVDTQLGYIDAQADAARTWAEVERTAGGNLP